MALKMILGKGADLVKLCADLPRNDRRLLTKIVEEAMKAYSKAMEMYPDNAEMIFWPAVTLAATGRVEESLPLFNKVFAMDTNWAILVPRLPQVGQLPKHEALIKRILAQAPPRK